MFLLHLGLNEAAVSKSISLLLYLMCNRQVLHVVGGRGSAGGQVHCQTFRLRLFWSFVSVHIHTVKLKGKKRERMSIQNKMRVEW